MRTSYPLNNTANIVAFITAVSNAYMSGRITKIQFDAYCKEAADFDMQNKLSNNEFMNVSFN